MQGIVSVVEAYNVVPLSQLGSMQLSQEFLDRSIGEWRRRLENVVQCNGGHIEHVC